MIISALQFPFWCR